MYPSWAACWVCETWFTDQTNSPGATSLEHINPCHPWNYFRSGFCFLSWSETASSKRVDFSLFHASPSFQHTNVCFFSHFSVFPPFLLNIKVRIRGRPETSCPFSVDNHSLLYSSRSCTPYTTASAEIPHESTLSLSLVWVTQQLL